MIDQIEPQLVTALAPLSARFPGLVVHAGPGALAGPGPALVVWARGLRFHPRDTHEAASPQLGARLTPRAGLDAGTWTLAGVDAVSEVLGADGRALVRGEDWTCEPGADGLLLRLRTAAAPIVWVRGSLARGFTSRGPCIIKVSLVAIAARASDADAMTDAALRLGLPVLASLPPLERASFPATLPPGAGVRARLDGAQVTVRAVQRRWVSGAPGHVAVTTALVMKGELELEVAVGAPEPAGVIARVVGQLGGAAFTVAGPEQTRVGG